VQLWADVNYSGDQLQIYGYACNAYGELSTLGFMNKRASSWKLDCHGQVSGYYYDNFWPDQNFGCGSGLILFGSQVNDSQGNLRNGGANDTWQSMKNEANQPTRTFWCPVFDITYG
jgi:hypothetical protein